MQSTGWMFRAGVLSENDKWREENPGCSLDMKRYAKRYRNPGTLRAKYPFSAKRK